MSPEAADQFNIVEEFKEEFERRREIIAEFIRERGRVSFRDFVWANLYHPEAGYYVKGDLELIAPYDDFRIDRNLRQVAIECAVRDMFDDGEIVELKYLGDEEKVREGFRGVIVANEYFTSLPFHLIKNWKEVYVEYEDDFVEVLEEPEGELEEFLSYARPHVRVKSFAVSVDAVEKAEEIASKLEEGYLLVIDYGLPIEEYYCRKLRLACFSKGSFSHDPYTSVGRKAISAPVDFTSIIEAAERGGMEIAGFTSYRYFLLNTVGKDETEEPSDFKSIAMPVTPKVLVMQKGLEWRKLKCLQNVPEFGYWLKYNRNVEVQSF